MARFQGEDILKLLDEADSAVVALPLMQYRLRRQLPRMIVAAAISLSAAALWHTLA